MFGDEKETVKLQFDNSLVNVVIDCFGFEENAAKREAVTNGKSQTMSNKRFTLPKRILHISDWHLGKSLEQINYIDE